MDSEMLMETGKRKGLANKEHIEKDYFQDLLLHRIFKKTNVLIFKGGTALYKIYKLPRFSEDLDFTLAGEVDVGKLIRGIGNSMNSDVNEKQLKDSALFKIRFEGILTRSNTVIIDISTKNRIIGGFDVRNYVPEYADINPFAIRVLKPEEMIAEKIHSIFARSKARDLYDLFFLLRISGFNRKLVDNKLEIFNMKFSPSSFKRKVNTYKEIWKPELSHFVLDELMDFNTVRKFVLERVK